MFWEDKNICKPYCEGCHFKQEFRNNFYCLCEVGSVLVGTKCQDVAELSYTARHISRGLMIKKNCPFFQKRKV